MTLAQRLTEARNTVAFLDRHRVRHERICRCGLQCPAGLALAETLADARERARRIEVAS